MRDVQHQLTDYWAEITSDLEAPTLDDVLVERVGEGEVRPLVSRLDTRHRPGWVTAAVAFGLVVVAGFAAWMVGIGGETAEVTDDTPTVTQTSTVTTVASDETAPVTTVALPDPDEPGPTVPVTNLINVVRDVAAAPDGSIWAATAGGVVRWDPTTQNPAVHSWEAIGLEAPPSAVSERSRIVVAADGIVWAGGVGWLARWDGAWQTFDVWHETTPPLAVDLDGAVWLGDVNSSVLRFDGMEWETHLYVAPLRTESMAVAPDGTVWAGTSSSDDSRDGLRSYNGETWTRHGLNGTLFPATIGDSVAVAADGTLWVGSRGVDSAGAAAGGVARFDGTAWTVFTAADGLVANRSEPVVGSDGTVWAVSAEGVARFDGTGFVQYSDTAGFGLGAAVDTSGTVWAPSLGLGVVGFDGVEVVHLEVPVQTAQDSWQIEATYDGWLNPVGFAAGFAAIRVLDPVRVGATEIWLSPDGLAWEPAPSQPGTGIVSLVSDGTTLFVGTESDDLAYAVWTSGDGADWVEAIAGDEFIELLDIGVGGCRGWCGASPAVAAGPAGAVTFGVDQERRIVGLVYRNGRFERSNLGEIADLNPSQTTLTVAVLEGGMIMTVQGDDGFGAPLVSSSTTGEFWPAPGQAPDWSPLSQPAAEIRWTESFGGLDLVGLGAGYGLWETDGILWNEIRPRPGLDGWGAQVAASEAGWVVYSPASRSWFDAEQGTGGMGPFPANLGLWYSPDVMTWNELGDLGPLVPVAGLDEFGTLQAQVLVDGSDLLVFAHVGEAGGWGLVRGARTEIWRLPLGDGPWFDLASGTITIELDDPPGVSGYQFDAWVLPLEPTDDKFAHGGLRTTAAPALSEVIRLQGLRYFDVGTAPATFAPGRYRLVVEVYEPSGPMLFGCEQMIEVLLGEPLTVAFSEIPEYDGDGWFWTQAGEDMGFPTCPGGVPVP